MNGCPIPQLMARIAARERPIVCRRLVTLHRRAVSEGRAGCTCRNVFELRSRKPETWPAKPLQDQLFAQAAA
jgi:hypothetical protein